jgi:CheY-like chemotaxis protein/predicted  nucleic acid-binding Zn-ribbon protein
MSPQRNPKLIDVQFPPASEVASVGDNQPSDIRALMNQLQQTAYELRHRLSAVEDERNKLATQVESLHDERAREVATQVPAPIKAAPQTIMSAPPPNDPLRLQNLELSRMADGLRRALTESEKRVEAAQSQIASLRMARDTAQAQNRELLDKVQNLEWDLADLRLNDEERRAAPPTVGAQAATSAELEEARRAQAQAQANFEGAQKRIEILLCEQDDATDKALQAQLELQVLRDRCQAAEDAGGAGNPDRDMERELLQQENRELKARLEAQRVETIDLAARFQATQDQIKNLSASLAELRLQAKAQRGASPAVAPVAFAIGPVIVEASEPLDEELMPAEGLVGLSVREPFSVAQAQATLKEMRRCYQAYARDQEDLSHLNELHCAVKALAAQAERSGLVAFQKIAEALAVLVQELYHFPEQISTNVLTTVVHAIEFLTTAVKMRDLGQLREPSEISVCVVDDDAATCECLLMAMESVDLRASSYRDSAKALNELSKDACDLIVLDVQMPGMDGFELCTEVRQQAHHKATPVLFVTGRTEPEIRSRSTLSGGNDLMNKPFMLCELGLKALLLTAKAQLLMV